MQTSERAVERLTKTHGVKIGDQEATCEPLITVLREARYPNIGRTKGGGGSGDMLDTKAIDLYETLDGGIRSWLNHYRQHNTGDLAELTVRLHDILRAEDAGGRLEDRERTFDLFPKWVDRIENHFDPPHEYELTAPCPGKPEVECGVSKVTDDDGGQRWAVRVPVRAGHALIAGCYACGSLWAGDNALIDLAEQMGIEVDWATLRTFTNTPKDDASV